MGKLVKLIATKEIIFKNSRSVPKGTTATVITGPGGVMVNIDKTNKDSYLRDLVVHYERIDKLRGDWKIVESVKAFKIYIKGCEKIFQEADNKTMAMLIKKQLERGMPGCEVVVDEFCVGCGAIDKMGTGICKYCNK